MMLLQIFQNVDKSMNHNKKHEVLLVSQMVKLRQSNQILKERNEESDIKIRQSEKQTTELSEQNVVLTKTVGEVSSTLKTVDETMQAGRRKWRY